MQLAGEAYRQGKHQEALAIYSELVSQGITDALLNRASLLYGEAEFTGSLADARKYLEVEQPKVEGYVLLASSLIKSKAEITEKDRELLEKGKSAYPYHKKLQDTLTVLNEKVDDS